MLRLYQSSRSQLIRSVNDPPPIPYSDAEREAQNLDEQIITMMDAAKVMTRRVRASPSTSAAQGF
jgi:hypothetical protein